MVWESAPNMTHASFNYIITYETTGTNSSEITTTNTSQILSGLSSGTTYNISVATVGPMDLKSEPVFMYFVTTSKTLESQACTQPHLLCSLFKTSYSQFRVVCIKGDHLRLTITINIEVYGNENSHIPSDWCTSSYFDRA